MENTRGTLQFQLFGIPIVISPYSWLILALLGGGLGAEDLGDIRGILIFVVVGMITLLVHELGHALVGRALGGDPQGIIIEGLGAATYSRPPAGRLPYFLMVLAGPLATLLPGLVAGAIMGLNLFHNPILGILAALTLPLGITPDCVVEAMQNSTAGGLSPFMMQLYSYFMIVPLWWCLFNLLPVYPMDGGMLLDTLCRSHRIVGTVGIVLSILIAIAGMCDGSFFLLILFGYFAYINWLYLRYGKES